MGACVSVTTWYCSVSGVDPADGPQAVLLAEPIGHVGQRQAGGRQSLGVDLDDDLADVAALDRNVGDVVDAADPRAKIVVGVFAQRRRIAAAGHDEGNDRERSRASAARPTGWCPAETGCRFRPPGRERRSAPGSSRCRA